LTSSQAFRPGLTPDTSTNHPLPQLRRDLATIIQAAIAAVDAARLVERALADQAMVAMLRAARHVDAVSAGKAAAAMLAGFAAASPVAIRSMLGVGPVGPGVSAATLPPGAAWQAGAHPVPDERSVAAARRVIDTAEATSPADLLVVLLSGGASAMMAMPAGELSLADKRRTNELLLRAGASIGELNIVRKHLSAVKGGRLAASAHGPVLTLAISDVVGDDLSTIASGPTVPDPTTFAQALDVLDRCGGRHLFPSPVIRWLTRGAGDPVTETPKPDHPRFERSLARVIGSRLTAVEGATRAAASIGYRIYPIEAPVVGEARLAGRALIEAASGALTLREATPLCIVASGETTVQVKGHGRGGRNQECALAMALTLETLGSPVVAASVGTDGVDGPTDAAGAIVDSTTLSRAAAAELIPEVYLNDNDTYTFFNNLGDLLRTGPTGTNVGDLQVILIG
jgi:glycerate 2-kinase